MDVVIDASAAVDLLVTRPSSAAIATALLDADQLHAPEHLRIETAHALRGLRLGGHLGRNAFIAAMDRLAAMPLTTHPVAPLLRRISELSPNATAYDAAYIALAERLEAPYFTADARLSGVPNVRCDVRVIRG